MVAAAIAAGLSIAVTVTPPTEVPAIAMRAEAVYRVEVGGAVFIGLYVATMAFALALRNRGFTEFGRGGVRAESLAEDSDEALFGDYAMELLADLSEEVENLEGRLERARNA